MTDHKPLVRANTDADGAAIGRVHRAAFAGEEEARLAREVPAELSLVAEAASDVVGHVHLSRAHVDEAPVLALGLIGVLPELQSRGIGSLLMEAIAEADARGEPLIALLGHPWYYPRFGFRPARALGIEPSTSPTRSGCASRSRHTTLIYKADFTTTQASGRPRVPEAYPKGSTWPFRTDQV